ncbi:transposase [Bradyrhizobium sp. USDA 4486]
MDDHSDDIRRPLSPRIEMYAGAGRKNWPDDLKAQIVAESLEVGAVVGIARHHGCRPQQVHDWRPGAFGPVGATWFGGHAVVRWCRSRRYRRPQSPPGRRKQPL